MNLAKVLGGTLAVVVVLNFVLLTLKRVPVAVFWLVIILSAIVAYLVLPKLKK